MTDAEEKLAMQDYLRKMKEIRELRLAAIRIAPMLVFHLFLGFFASLYYSTRTGYWTPFISATIPGMPIAILGAAASASGQGGAIVFSWFLGIIPPAISFFVFNSKVNEMRVRHKIVAPEEADFKLSKLIVG